jgi:hypothetical protein
MSDTPAPNVSLDLRRVPGKGLRHRLQRAWRHVPCPGRLPLPAPERALLGQQRPQRRARDVFE